MKITCRSCQSKYTVSDEKVQGKTVKIKCRKCGATILVNSGGVTTSAPADPVSLSTGGAADGGASYLVNVAEGDQRSMTLPEIVAAYQGSVVTADTYVWADGMGDWQPLGQVDAIVAALNSPPAAAPEPRAAEPAYASSGGGAEPEHRAAARRDPARGARDLFGNRQDEAPPAAASGNGAPMPRAMPSAPMGGGGQRSSEENSMLFSLSALTAKPSSSGAGSPSRATTARDREDSGIIDLKALAAAAAVQSAPQASSASSAFLPDGGLFPLGAPMAAPQAAPPVVSPSMPPPKSKTPIFLGLGGLVAVGAIVGAFLIMRGGPPPVPVAAAADSASAAPTATVSAAPSATASADASAAAAASAAADASAAAAASAVAKAGKGGKGGTSKGGAAPAGKGGAAAPAAAAPAAAAPAAAAPKKSSCGCAPGDLMCAMKCSAK